MFTWWQISGHNRIVTPIIKKRGHVNSGLFLISGKRVASPKIRIAMVHKKGLDCVIFDI